MIIAKIVTHWYAHFYWQINAYKSIHRCRAFLCSLVFFHFSSHSLQLVGKWESCAEKIANRVVRTLTKNEKVCHVETLCFHRRCMRRKRMYHIQSFCTKYRTTRTENLHIMKPQLNKENKKPEIHNWLPTLTDSLSRLNPETDRSLSLSPPPSCVCLPLRGGCCVCWFKLYPQSQAYVCSSVVIKSIAKMNWYEFVLMDFDQGWIYRFEMKSNLSEFEIHQV